jgi:hypothetical protein
VGYLNTHLPQRRQWAADPNNPTRANDSTLVSGIESTIGSFQEGRSQNGTYKYRYNVFGVYTFQRAPIKGLRMGPGSQFFGSMIIENEINRSFDYVYRRSYHMVTGNIGYPLRFRHRKVDVQINVDNLLNYDKPLYNGLFVQAVPTGWHGEHPLRVQIRVATSGAAPGYFDHHRYSSWTPGSKTAAIEAPHDRSWLPHRGLD